MNEEEEDDDLGYIHDQMEKSTQDAPFGRNLSTPHAMDLHIMRRHQIKEKS